MKELILIIFSIFNIFFKATLSEINCNQFFAQKYFFVASLSSIDINSAIIVELKYLKYFFFPFSNLFSNFHHLEYL